MITITNLAKHKIKDLITSNSGKSAYLYLKGGGCNGLKYNLEPFFNEPHKRDELVELEDLKVNVCGKSLLYLLSRNV